jgi:hypothetical protein
MDKEADKLSAEAELVQAISDAKAEMDSFEMLRKFRCENTVVDKDGEKTKALEINLDKPGIIGKMMRMGNPVSYQQSGEIEIDDEKVFAYCDWFSNIELTDENLDLIGFQAIQAQEVVKAFFMLRLVLSIELAPEQEK